MCFAISVFCAMRLRVMVCLYRALAGLVNAESPDMVVILAGLIVEAKCRAF